MHALIQEETKATSQHQITIPKKIWAALHLKEGMRFSIALTKEKQILVQPKEDAFELSTEEWKKLLALAHSKTNISKSFSSSKEALAHLKKL